jgi:hypothetical protein
MGFRRVIRLLLLIKNKEEFNIYNLNTFYLLKNNLIYIDILKDVIKWNNKK